MKAVIWNFWNGNNRSGVWPWLIGTADFVIRSKASVYIVWHQKTFSVCIASRDFGFGSFHLLHQSSSPHPQLSLWGLANHTPSHGGYHERGKLLKLQHVLVPFMSVSKRTSGCHSSCFFLKPYNPNIASQPRASRVVYYHEAGGDQHGTLTCVLLGSEAHQKNMRWDQLGSQNYLTSVPCCMADYSISVFHLQ